MAHLLDRAYRRLDRARKHLTDLEREVARLRTEQARAVSAETEPETGDYLLRVRRLDSPELADQVSDFLSNVRPPLDHLVYALALRDSRKRQRDTRFPLTGSPKGFRKEARQYLKGVSPVHVAHIWRLQPYRTGNEWLRRLGRFSNPDKHRFTVTVLSGRDPAYRILRAKPPEPPRARQRRDATAGQVLRRAKDDDVAVYLGLRLSVRFRDGGDVLDTLREFESKVRGVLDSFRGDLA